MMTGGNLDQVDWCREAGCWFISVTLSQYSVSDLRCSHEDLRKGCTFDHPSDLKNVDYSWLSYRNVWLRFSIKDVTFVMKSCCVFDTLVTDGTSPVCCPAFGLPDGTEKHHIVSRSVPFTIRGWRDGQVMISGSSAAMILCGKLSSITPQVESQVDWNMLK